MYFISRNNIKEGPYTFNQIRDFNLTEDTLIWKEGLVNWVKIKELQEFESLIIKSPPPLPFEVEKKERNDEILKIILKNFLIGLVICLVLNLIAFWGAKSGGTSSKPVYLTETEQHNPIIVYFKLMPYAFIIGQGIMLIFTFVQVYLTRNKTYSSFSISASGIQEVKGIKKEESSELPVLIFLILTMIVVTGFILYNLKEENKYQSEGVESLIEPIRLTKEELIITDSTIITEDNQVDDLLSQPQNGEFTVTDIDGNIYKTIKIGNQVWMAENLKTTRYNDGTPIPNVTDNNEWSKLKTGAFCYYDNDSEYNTIYGKLYNWYAVGTGKLAPKGWHVPSDDEWKTLTTYLGGEEIAGGKMKSTQYWQSPNVGASNSSGFNGLPGASRTYNKGMYTVFGYYGFFWSSENCSYSDTYIRMLDSHLSDAYKLAHFKASGFSVRCIKD